MTKEQLDAIRARVRNFWVLKRQDFTDLLAEVERLRVALTAYGIDHRLGWDECRACRQRNEHRENAKSRQKNYHLPSCVFYPMFSRKEDKP